MSPTKYNAAQQIEVDMSEPIIVQANGLPFDAAGRLCVSTDTPAWFQNGIPFNASGRVCIGDGGPVPSFSQDFSSATALDPRVDFTRGSEATGWVNGQLKTFGIDEPRFVTDPATGYSGLLLEPFASTNLLLNSEVVADQTIIVPSGDITLSFYGEGEVSFTGAATGALQGAGGNARAEITVTAAAGALVLSVTDGSPILGQLEPGTKATSYIPTGDSQVIRAGDFSKLPTGDWYRPDQGTLLADAVVLSGAMNGGNVANLREDGSSFISLPSVSSTGARRRMNVNVAGQVTSTTELLPRIEFGERLVSAAGWDGSGFVYAGNGIVSDAALSPVGYPNPGELRLFTVYNGTWANQANTPYGIIRRVAYYPERLTDAQLAALTEVPE